MHIFRPDQYTCENSKEFTSNCRRCTHEDTTILEGTEGRLEGRNAEYYVPSLLFEKAGEIIYVSPLFFERQGVGNHQLQIQNHYFILVYLKQFLGCQFSSSA